MKRIRFSPTFIKKLQIALKKDTMLYHAVKKQLNVFQANPKHPSLRTHKLSGNLKNTWSISITKKYRILYTVEDVYYFFEMGTHDEVYK